MNYELLRQHTEIEKKNLIVSSYDNRDHHNMEYMAQSLFDKTVNIIIPTN